MTSINTQNNLGTGLAILAILLGGGLVPLAFAQSPQVQTSQQWWNPQYGFRQSLNLTNPLATAVTSYPFFVYMTFQPSRLSDASTELRVVDQNGQELPSFVMDEASSNGSVTWAWLLIPMSLPASALASLEVYYGNSAAALPAYRTALASANASAGPVTLSLASSQPGSSSFVLSYQHTYNQTFTSKVTYTTDTQRSYGSGGLASQPETALSSWEVFSVGGLTGASSSYLAGDYRVSQALIVRNGSVTVARLLTSQNAPSVSDLKLTDYIDSSELSTLGQAVSNYYVDSGALSSSVDGAFLDYVPSATPTGFEVGTAATVSGQVSSNTLAMETGPAPAAAAAVSWDFGGGPKVGNVEVLTEWTVAPGSSGLKTAPPAGSAKLGVEESLGTQSTQAESFWNADLPVRNVSISRGGLALPFSPTGAQPIASQMTLNGTVSYTIPSDISQGWKPEVGPVGAATTTATTGFYSVQIPGFVDSVRVLSPDANSPGQAQLVSPTFSLPGSVSRSILIQYKATFAGAGDFSQQSLYAALDVGSASTGLFAQTLLISALGSSQDDSCGSLLVPKGAPPAATAKVEGSLIADGSWRTLKVDLNSIEGPSPLILRLRFCAATAQPFSGQVELDVATAGIYVESAATNFLAASIQPGEGAVQLSFLPGASFEPSVLEFSGDISIPMMGLAPLNWDGSEAFTGKLGWPTLGASQNSSNTAAAGRVSLLGARILTPLLSLEPLVLVNGTRVRATVAGQEVDIAPNQITALGSFTGPIDLSLSFPDYYLSVAVADARGVPVSGASITVSGQGTQIKNATTTNKEGVATLPLMNGTYDLTVSFGGTDVGAATVQLASNQSLNIPTQVNLTTLRVKDLLGSPIQGATVSVAYNSENLNLTTDSKGTVSFPAIANAVYAVSVMVGGEPYYAGTVSTSIYGAVIQVPTSYLSQSLKIVIVSGLVLTLLAVAAGLYLLRRYQVKRTISLGSYNRLDETTA